MCSTHGDCTASHTLESVWMVPPHSLFHIDFQQGTCFLSQQPQNQLRKWWPHGKGMLKWAHVALVSYLELLVFSVSDMMPGIAVSPWNVINIEMPWCLLGAPGHLLGHHGNWVLSAAAASLKVDLWESSTDDWEITRVIFSWALPIFLTIFTILKML